jgi:hypothetical protein
VLVPTLQYRGNYGLNHVWVRASMMVTITRTCISQVLQEAVLLCENACSSLLAAQPSWE